MRVNHSNESSDPPLFIRSRIVNGEEGLALYIIFTDPRIFKKPAVDPMEVIPVNTPWF